MKFGQLILRKIIEIVAIRCQILRLKCTKFNFGWGSVPDPAGGAYSAPPDPVAGFKGPTSIRERRGGKENEGTGMGRGGEWDGREGKGGEGGAEGEEERGRWWGGRGNGKGGQLGKERGKGMWRGPESGLPRGPRWLSAGLGLMTHRIEV